MLSQRAVSVLLATHLLVVWTAVALRVDRYPLTWAPMYTDTKEKKSAPKPTTTVKLKDNGFLESNGWHATHRDGTRSWVKRSDINVVSRNMWRLYYERTFGKTSPKYKQLNSDSGNFDRWLFGLEPGEPFVKPNPQRDLLVSINRTLGHRVEDPAFIVELEATMVKRVIERATGEEVDRRSWTIRVPWEDAWADRMR